MVEVEFFLFFFFAISSFCALKKMYNMSIYVKLELLVTSKKTIH